MSYVDIGPTNTGTSRPFLIDPEYRSGVICDIHDEWIVTEVDDDAGLANAVGLREAGHKLKEEALHVCDACAERIFATPICARCGEDKEQGKPGEWWCITDGCTQEVEKRA